MAGYFPNINNYESLAEQTLNRRASTPSPWAALAQTIGGLANQYGQQRLDARIAATQQQGKEKIAEIGAQKARDVADIRGDSSFMNTHTEVTQDMVDKNPALKDKGVEIGEWYPNKWFDKNLPKSAGGAGSAQFRPNDKQQALLNKAAEEHRLPPDYLSRRGNLEQYVRKLEENPNFDFVKLGTDVAGQKTEAASQGRVRGDLGSKSAATGQTIDEIFDQMEPLIKKTAPTGIRVVNSAAQALKLGVNDPNATKLEGLIQSARSLYAQQLQNQGVPAVQSKLDAEKALPSGMDAKGFQAAKEAIKFESTSRAKNLKAVGKPDPAKRFSELIASGKSEDEAYKILAAEGH